MLVFTCCQTPNPFPLLTIDQHVHIHPGLCNNETEGASNPERETEGASNPDRETEEASN
jgi:hypothetical protein